ncbi:uncharacterized protein LOC128167006 [Crassostrea angulata]|uniref:uncharacterized protein LOC128167006 n=1 Tax=Magallana angulata TaxID=2784310 RepID=UPI00097517B5|nr:uncharacterized protein LOC128167006 [Crassostrea angulata]|eukprot:XP_019928270.1 PREDICTED: uncharacterized protein LOC109620393 [Crassostrea gigas]
MACHHFLLLFFATLFQESNASDQTFALCADQRGFIRCDNGSKIKIVSANYGRTDDQVCPGGKTNTITCRSKSSEIKVKWNCNGYATCHLQATNGYFGDPCANIVKYLEVRYRCVKNIDKEVKDKSIIAFNAYISKHLTLHRNTPVNVVYDKLFFNYGNAYNPHSGIFTAPSAGLYIFTWTSLVNGRTIFDAEIIVNGKRKGLGNCNNESNPGFENCANTIPLVLNAGDRVNIRTTTANFLYGEWSSFKGWKV